MHFNTVKQIYAQNNVLHSFYKIQWLYVLQIHHMPQLLKTQNTCLSAAEINKVVTSIKT